MANTRKATKRAGQALKRQSRNVLVRSATRTAIRGVVDALKGQDLTAAKAAYVAAVKAVAKAASKGGIPKGRAARKIGRLTRMVKKLNPSALNFKTK